MSLTSKKLLEDQYNELFWKRITNEKSHFQTRHSELNDVDLLDRALTEGHSTSSFSSYEDMKDLIEEAIISKLPDINQQLLTAKNGQNIAVFMDFPDSIYKSEDDPYDFNTHHKGFRYDKKGNVKEIDTTSLILVFEKDRNSIYGLSLLTAYPDVNDDRGKETKKDLSPILEKTSVYKDASKLKKISLLNSISDKPKNLSYEKIKGNERVLIDYPINRKEKYQLSIENDKDTLVKKVKKNNRRKSIKTDLNKIAFESYNDTKIQVDIKKPKIQESLKNNHKNIYNDYKEISKVYENVEESSKKRKLINKENKKEKDLILEI